MNRRQFLTSTAATSIIVAAGPTELLAGQDTDAFRFPAPSARPWVRWWWPGGSVNSAELKREIDLLKANGFGGAEIQAFNPGIPRMTPEERSHVNDFANDAFFGHVNDCAAEGLRDGLSVDYTFGSAWPSGGGFAVTPELALLELTPSITTVEWPSAEPIKVALPPHTRKFGALNSLDVRVKDPRAAGWKERLEARQKLIAVVAIKATSPVLKTKKSFRDSDVETSGKTDTATGLVVTHLLREDGTLGWTPPSSGTWQIVAFKQFTVDSSAMGAVGEGPQLVLDHFNAAAFQAHAHRVGDPLKSLAAKSGLRATFVDSLELMADLYWSEDFLEQFHARRGYDLTPYLPHLLQPGWESPWNPRLSPPYFDGGEIGDRVREDYHQTVSDLIIERFWMPFVQWNHANGFKARLQAGGSPSDHLMTQGLADICETEDLGTGGNPHRLRMARSAADLYGRKLVSCESLCWPLKPYEKTIPDWVERANLLFASGVNHLIYHGFPYAFHTDTWPGWHPFAPSPFLGGFSSQINEANPVWAGIETFNAYVARLQVLLQQGTPVVSVAVLHQDIGFGSNAGEPSTEHILEDLLKAGFDYDRINTDGLQHAQVLGKRLESAGGVSYQALLVPPLPSIRPEAAKRLADIAKAGVRVVFLDKAPKRAWGLGDTNVRDGVVNESLAAATVAGANTIELENLSASLTSLGMQPNVRFVKGTALFVQRQVSDGMLFFFHNPKAEPVDLTVAVHADGFGQRLDAMTGSRVQLPFARSGHEAKFDIHIEAGGEATILFAKAPAKTLSATMPIRSYPLDNKWLLRAKGHGQGGTVIDTSLSDFGLIDLATTDALRNFSGEAAYSTFFDVPKDWRPGAPMVIDLGAVRDMAIVELNGKAISTAIARPYRIDITRAVKQRRNALIVRVYNNPNNAMIDPKAAGMRDLKPVPAGLVGPVILRY